MGSVDEEVTPTLTPRPSFADFRFSEHFTACASGLDPHRELDSFDSNLPFQNTTNNEVFCEGQWVVWYPGSIWDTYAYQQHEHKSIPWFLIGMEGGRVRLHLPEISWKKSRDQYGCMFGLRFSFEIPNTHEIYGTRIPRCSTSHSVDVLEFFSDSKAFGCVDKKSEASRTTGMDNWFIIDKMRQTDHISGKKPKSGGIPPIEEA